jgi:hypothetical protein
MDIKFQYTPGKRYPYKWYYSPQGSEFNNVMKWTYETYGFPGDRWDCHGGSMMFSTEEDALLFTLRWA